MHAVEEVLAEILPREVARLVVLNKADRLADEIVASSLTSPACRSGNHIRSFGG